MSNFSNPYFTVWSMNGSPLPKSAFDAISKAFEDSVLQAEKDSNVRLLWASKSASEEEKGK